MVAFISFYQGRVMQYFDPKLPGNDSDIPQDRTILRRNHLAFMFSSKQGKTYPRYNLCPLSGTSCPFTFCATSHENIHQVLRSRLEKSNNGRSDGYLELLSPRNFHFQASLSATQNAAYLVKVCFCFFFRKKKETRTRSVGGRKLLPHSS